MAVASDAFVGAISTRCRRCDTDLRYPADATIEPRRLTCRCGKWLASGRIDKGWINMTCPRDRTIVHITPTGLRMTEIVRRSERPWRPPISAQEVVALVEERWEMLRFDRARRSTEIAVGIRFDVLNRDGFRCTYCGRGPDQGVLLEVDHVVPRSAGGEDTLDNLVTACWDCNRGKAAKALDRTA
jgi:hypothetical protein